MFILCDELIALENACDKLVDKVIIKLNHIDVTEQHISRIKDICQKHKGPRPVYVNLKTEAGHRVSAMVDKKLNVRPDIDFCRKLEAVVGVGNVTLTRR